MTDNDNSLGQIAYAACPSKEFDQDAGEFIDTPWKGLPSWKQEALEKRAQAVAVHVRAETIEECAMIADAAMQPELDAYDTRASPTVAARIRNEIRDLNKEQASQCQKPRD